MIEEREVWKPVVGYEGVYEVSNLGQVRRIITRGGKPCSRIVKWGRHTAGYCWIYLSCAAQGLPARKRCIHSLVAEAFIGPRKPKEEVNHKDGDKWNPRLSNLEYVTHAENLKHAGLTGLMRRGSGRPDAKLDEEKVRFIRDNKGKISQYDMAAMFGVCQPVVSLAAIGRTWKHVK